MYQSVRYSETPLYMHKIIRKCASENAVFVCICDVYVCVCVCVHNIIL